MENRKYIQKLLGISDGYGIDRLRKKNLEKTHVAFEGTPKKHHHDNKMIILLVDPFSPSGEFYEFTMDSIGHVEDLGTITTEDGKSITKIRIWIKKGMPAIFSRRFTVE